MSQKGSLTKIKICLSKGPPAINKSNSRNLNLSSGVLCCIKMKARANVSTSPFAKIADVNQSVKSDVPIWQKNFKETVFNAVVSSTSQIPNDDVKKLPDAYQAIFGVLYVVLAILLLVGLCILTTSNPPYLAPHPFTTQGQEANVQNYQNRTFGEFCRFVPITTSGNYQLDSKGIWSSNSTGYYAKIAQFDLQLSGYNQTFTEYKKAMNDIYDSINVLYVQYSSDFGTAQITLAFWMTFASTLGKDIDNSYVRYTGQPSVIFRSDTVSGILSNRYGICDLNSITSLSLFDMTAFLAFSSYSTYSDNEKCMDILNVSMLNDVNSQPVTNENSFRIDLDVLSLIVAFSVNNLFIQIISFPESIKSCQDVNYNPYDEGVTPNPLFYSFSFQKTSSIKNSTETMKESIYLSHYSYSSYIYSLYPGMSPITCFFTFYFDTSQCTNGQGVFIPQTFCGVQFYNTIAIPIFQTKGNSSSEPVMCDCPSVNGEECSNFDLIYGVAILDDFNFYTDFQPQLSSMFNYFSNKLFNATFSGSYWGQNTADSIYRSEEFTNSAFEPCYNGIGYNCSLLLFSSVNYDPSILSRREVSPSGYTINQFCTNNFLLSEEQWNLAINYPPVPLEQDYMICTTSSGTVIIKTLGVSVANLLSLLPLLSIVISGIIFVFVSKFRVPVTYTDSEKASALDAFATALLLARDKKLKKSKSNQDQDFTPLNGIVKNLEYTADVDTFAAAEEVYEKRRNDNIEYEMTQISEIKNPLVSGQGETFVILNNYTLDGYCYFDSIVELEQFIERLLHEMIDFMKVRYDIHGTTTDLTNKTAYLAVRNFFSKTANLKNAHFDLFETISEYGKSIKAGDNKSLTEIHIKNLINRSSESRGSIVDKLSHKATKKMIEVDLDDFATSRVIQSLSELLYIHGKLAAGVNMIDTMNLNEKMANDLNFSKKISYRIGDFDIELQHLNLAKKQTSFTPVL